LAVFGEFLSNSANGEAGIFYQPTYTVKNNKIRFTWQVNFKNFLTKKDTGV